MSLKSTVSSKIFDLNSLIFNNLRDTSTSRQTGSKWDKKPPFAVNNLRLSNLALPGSPSGMVFQVQRDEFHRFPAIKHGVGKKPLHHHSHAPKSDSRHQRHAITGEQINLEAALPSGF